MKRTIITFFALVVLCAAVSAQNHVNLYQDEALRPIGMMNGVGGGPSGYVTKELYKAAGIPFARLHDIGNSERHCVEIMNIFPNFDADENKAESYDFVMTDFYIKKIIDSGTKIIWRLGNTGHEPTSVKKYGAWPPKDFEKWARICEHIVRHYNDGWADGFYYNIEYWEIWNEPDGDQQTIVDGKPRYQVSPHSWGGTIEQYFDLFETTFKYLKKTHPNLKIGGPAFAGIWANEMFMEHMNKVGVKPDFYSWHTYARIPEKVVEKGATIREQLDRYGWKDVPSILDEWNYNTTWNDVGAKYSREVRGTVKGAAFVAATMCAMQSAANTDILTYYDFRPNTSYNGAFDKETTKETWTYYVFTAWKKLRDYGTQVKVEVDSELKDVYTVAAKNPDGKLCMLLIRYNDDDAVFQDEIVNIPLPDGCAEPMCLLSDKHHMNCLYPFPVNDGVLKLTLEPNSLVFILFN